MNTNRNLSPKGPGLLADELRLSKWTITRGDRVIATVFCRSCEPMVSSPYSALVESASRLADVDLLEDVNQDCIDDANMLIERIYPILDATRKGALQRCEVPVVFKPDFFSHHMDDLQNLRNLSRAFYFASQVAAFNADLDLVAQYGVTLLDLANATRRGGLIVDHLVAVALIDCFSTLVIVTSNLMFTSNATIATLSFGSTRSVSLAVKDSRRMKSIG